ncbi:MAG: OmpP1/FadL family transporter [Luteibaculum sp.]
MQGARQTGMGHCGVSLLHGASNIFFNPGSLGFIPQRRHLSVSFNAVDARVVYFNPSTQAQFRNEPGIGTPFSFYAASKITDYLSVGVGVYTPFGSSLTWQEGWAGRFIINSIDLKTVYVQPTLSFKYGPIGLGIGLMLGHGSVVLQRDVPVTDQNGNLGSVELSGRDNAVGFNIGAFVELTPGFNFGISYRTEHRYEPEKGKADFTVPQSAEQQLGDQNIKAGIPAPSNLMVGLSMDVSPRFTLSGEVNFTGWKAYDRLEIDFENNSESLRDIDEPRNWRDSESFRFGVQYKASEKMSLRVGYSKDFSPVNPSFYSPETPDSDRSGYHMGFSYFPHKKLSVDGAFQWVEAEQIEAIHKPSGFSGVYKGRAFVYNVGVSYEF